jgi:hypothetical protein
LDKRQAKRVGKIMSDIEFWILQSFKLVFSNPFGKSKDIYMTEKSRGETMKNLSAILNLAILLAFGSACGSNGGETTEKEAARVPLENYLKGHATGDPEFMKKAFHTEGKLIFIREGKYSTRTFEEYINGMSGKSAEDEANRKRSIESIDIAGDTGVGKIVLDYPEVRFVDYLTLLKIDGEWKIVNKSFYAEPKK